MEIEIPIKKLKLSEIPSYFTFHIFTTKKESKDFLESIGFEEEELSHNFSQIKFVLGVWNEEQCFWNYVYVFYKDETYDDFPLDQ